MSLSARLVVLSGPQLGSVCDLSTTDVFVGRDSTNQLELCDLSVSRRHARIRRDESRFVLEDLDSANGTRLNGTPVFESELRDGDEISVGDTVMRFILVKELTELPVPLLDGDINSRATVRLSVENVSFSTSVHAGKILQELVELCHKALSSRDLLELEKSFVEGAIKITGATRAMLLRHDPGPPEGFSCSISFEGSVPCATPFAVSRTVLEETYKSRSALLIPDVAHHRFSAVASLRNVVHSLIAIPIGAGRQNPKLLYLDSSSPNAYFNGDRLEILMAAAGILALALENLSRAVLVEDENRQLQTQLKLRHSMVGNSPCMRDIYRKIGKVAASDSTVLLLGETGTGKELAARAIHENSARHARPFVAVNCALLNEALLESELFGHERGAFTGAVNQKIGKLEIADGGTIFLDELGELPLSIQAKLLRVIQERECERLGSTRTQKINVRILGATHRDLEEAVASGALREDLYYRLKVVTIAMPSLRDRRDDIPLLLRYLVNRCSERAKRRIDSIEPDVIRCLTAHSWPGNVRELENVIECALVMGEGSVLRASDLPESLFESAEDTDPSKAGYYVELNRAKHRIVRQALEAAGWNVTQAAIDLGVNRTYLHRLARNLRIKPTPE
jgi:transcriptional regulator with GAF, ATPase, and Fis domain